MKEDSRKVRYTRRVIREAYFELLKQKPIGQITIGELCDLADIHRGTFYQHYHDIYDLQDKIEESLVARFDEMFSHSEDSSADLVELTTMAIFEEKDACSALLGENGNTDVLRQIIEKSRQGAYSSYKKAGVPEADYNLVFTFATSGCIGVIRDWVMSGYREKPEAIVQTIRSLTQGAILSMSKRQA